MIFKKGGSFLLKDIKIGQHFPGNSFVHRLDPRTKIILTLAYITVLFFVNTIIGFVVPIAYLLAVIVISKIPMKVVFKSLKPIIPLIIFTSVLNMFLIDGKPIFEVWIFKMTYEGVFLAVIMVVRIICLIIGSSMMTFTTSPLDLTDAIERLLKPLKYIKFPAHEVAMMMTIALRFIPTLIEETDKIMSAQKARGADLETGNIIKRAKAMVPILIPLFVSAFRRAEELAMAMECRCYNGGEGRTRLKILSFSALDIIATVVSLVIFVLIIFVRFYF